MSRRIGLVLAGGRGGRLGRTKGDLIVRGRALAARAAEVLRPLCDTLFVSVAAGMANPAPGCEAIEDPPPAGRGPLAGIDAAFRRCGEVELLVLACDYPNVETELLERIVDAAGAGDDVVLPIDTDGRAHPLVALWRQGSASAVSRAVGQGKLTVHALLDGLSARRLGAGELRGIDLQRALVNLNRTRDLVSLHGRRDDVAGGEHDGTLEPPG
jgi:molybdopterin-guanine dinucleotide biosynthesis protein A